MVSGVLPEVGHDLGVGLGTAGLLVTVFSAVYALSAPVPAVATGNRDRRAVLLSALVVFVLANLAAAAAPNVAGRLIDRMPPLRIAAFSMAGLAVAWATPDPGPAARVRQIP
ncbi:hypothetical protein [Streptomyces spiralis]|uniref:hypothetical protein n=1 Tax=Streptomyces spiralis TaxID=66376 RepID=UPI0033D6EF0B